MDGDVAFVPVGRLPERAADHDRFVVIGAGKTAADAALWLLDAGVGPSRIRWIRPRDMWVNDRAGLQPLAQVGALMAGLADDAEAGAHASDLVDFCHRLEDAGRLLRLDDDVEPTMFRGTMLSRAEWEVLRTIEDVVRRGRAHRDDDAEKNRLTPPNPYPSTPRDMATMLVRTWASSRVWQGEPDVQRWIDASRLNLMRVLGERMGDPQVRAAVQRFVAHVPEASRRLPALR